MGGVKPIDIVDPSQLTRTEFRQYRVICAALFGFYKPDLFHYGGIRGSSFQKMCVPPAENFSEVTFDCSSFATWCYRVAGCPDPNGFGYNGQCSTASLWQNGRLVGGPGVAEKELIPGDLCFYGYEPTMHGGNSEHVCVFIDQGYVASHGSEHGPTIIKYKPGLDDKNRSGKPLVGVRRYEF